MQERKEEAAKAAKAADKETPVEAEDLTVFVQSVMEQMVSGAALNLTPAYVEACRLLSVLPGGSVREGRVCLSAWLAVCPIFQSTS